jgi:hypothetical protein
LNQFINSSSLGSDDKFFILLFSIFIAYGFIYLINQSVKNIKIYNKIKNIKTSNIKNLKINTLSEIKGKIIPPNKLLTSLINSKKCVYYKTTVKKKGNKNRWYTIIDKEMTIPFLINDGTGDIAVDPKDADISNLKYKYEKIIGEWVPKKDRKEIPEKISRFCILNGISTKGFLGSNRVIRFYETCLMPNEETYALGRVNKVSSGSNSSNLLKLIRDPIDKVLMISDFSEKELMKKYSVHYLTIPISVLLLSITLLTIIIVSKLEFYLIIFPLIILCFLIDLYKKRIIKLGRS